MKSLYFVVIVITIILIMILCYKDKLFFVFPFSLLKGSKLEIYFTTAVERLNSSTYSDNKYINTDTEKEKIKKNT